MFKNPSARRREMNNHKKIMSTFTNSLSRLRANKAYWMSTDPVKYKELVKLAKQSIKSERKAMDVYLKSQKMQPRLGLFDFFIEAITPL